MNWMRRLNRVTHSNHTASAKRDEFGLAGFGLLLSGLILLGVFTSPAIEAQTARQLVPPETACQQVAGEFSSSLSGDLEPTGSDSATRTPAGSEQLLTDSALTRNTQFTASMDVYWSYNEHQPLSGISNMRTFDDQTNQFALNLLELGIKRTPGAASPFGYNFQFGFGNAMTFVNGQNSGGPGFAEYLKEGYVSYAAPAGSGMQVDVGKFTPAISSEVMESQANWNYSRGLLYDYAVPYYLFGVRSHYAFGDKVSVTAYLVNGWNNIVDTYSSGKTIGSSVEWTPTRRLSITENYFTGRGATPEDIGTRRVSSTVVEYRATARLSLMGNGVYGLSRDFAPTGRTARWAGFAAYTRYRFSRDWFIAARYENYDDSNGATTCGLCQGTLTPKRLQEETLTVEKNLSEHLITRLEFRHDFSTAPVFFRAGTPIHAQNTITAGLMFTFGGRDKKGAH